MLWQLWRQGQPSASASEFSSVFARRHRGRIIVMWFIVVSPLFGLMEIVGIKVFPDNEEDCLSREPPWRGRTSTAIGIPASVRRRSSAAVVSRWHRVLFSASTGVEPFSLSVTAPAPASATLYRNRRCRRSPSPSPLPSDAARVAVAPVWRRRRTACRRDGIVTPTSRSVCSRTERRNVYPL